MGLFVNPDCSAFKAAVASEIYIDKTSLIKHTNQMLGTLQAFVCNSRPRRFGKSVTADMLTAYYSKGADASELFQGLAISQIPQQVRAQPIYLFTPRQAIRIFWQSKNRDNFSPTRKSLFKQMPTFYQIGICSVFLLMEFFSFFYHIIGF